MFWRKKQPSEQGVKTEVKKVKKLSPKETMIKQVEEMAQGQVVKFQLGEIYGGDLVAVELNPDYPDKGRKYAVSLGKVMDGEAVVKGKHLWDSNKPKDIAGWILNRDGKPFS